MGIVSRILSKYTVRIKVLVVQVSFINGMFPVSTNLSGVSGDNTYIKSRRFSNFIDASFFVARTSKINVLNSRDVLLIEAHGTESGYMMAGNDELMTIDQVISMCEGTNVGIIILATCYGDRIIGRGMLGGSPIIVYNVGKLYDNDAMIAVKRMIECLDKWPIRRTLRVINNARSGSNLWLMAGG